MGTVVAGDVFQRKLDEIYEGLLGVMWIADDIVIYGQNKEQHDRNILCFLEVTRKAGLWLNANKLQFQPTEVSFFGHHGTSHGIAPDPKKIKAITSTKFPAEKKTMQSFLGMISFLNIIQPKTGRLDWSSKSIMQATCRVPSNKGSQRSLSSDSTRTFQEHPTSILQFQFLIQLNRQIVPPVL